MHSKSKKVFLYDCPGFNKADKDVDIFQCIYKQMRKNFLSTNKLILNLDQVLSEELPLLNAFEVFVEMKYQQWDQKFCKKNIQNLIFLKRLSNFLIIEAKFCWNTKEDYWSHINLLMWFVLREHTNADRHKLTFLYLERLRDNISSIEFCE